MDMQGYDRLIFYWGHEWGKLELMKRMSLVFVYSLCIANGIDMCNT